MKHPGYHAARHSAKLENVAAVYKTATSLVARLPPPWERSKRGRPPKLSSREYLAVCIIYVCLDLTYREVEGFAPAFLDGTIDHSTVGKAFKRLKPGYVKLVLGLLRKRLKGHAEFDFYFVDSTGISTPRLKTRVKALKKVRGHEFYKLHVLVGYSSEASALVVLAARVTKPNVTDGSQLAYLLRGLEGGGKRLLGDSAYDWKRNIELALKRGFKPLFKPRDVGYHGVFRKMVLRDFKQNKRLYRMRGVGEATFGGIENRYGAHTRCKRVRTKVLSMLLMLVAHNLRTLMRVRAAEKSGFLFILWIFSTSSHINISAGQTVGGRKTQGNQRGIDESAAPGNQEIGGGCLL
jgi:hypothetical protein